MDFNGQYHSKDLPTISNKDSEPETFMKFDTEKIRMELLDPFFVEGVANILTHGAKKYAAWNWQKATDEDLERYKGALYRHWNAYMKGEVLDPDSGLPHMYHIGCNAMFLSYFDRQKEEI